MMCHVCVLSLVSVAAWGLSPVVAAGETSGSLMVGGDTITPTSAVAMWSESTAMWSEGATISQVYLAPAAIGTHRLATALNPDKSLRYGLEGDYVMVTLDESGAFSMISAYIGYAFITVGGKDWTGDKV